MKCPQCQFDSPPEMKFCGHCGVGLAAACPSCAIAAPAGFRFCGHCGTPLSSAFATAPAAGPSPPAMAGPTPMGVASPRATTPGPTPPPPAATPQNPSLAAAPVRTYTPDHLREKVLSSASALEGEHKPVTVLFCDLANSTATAEKLGAETMHDIFQHFFEISLEEIHRYEGTVNQFLGDGFMALFGAPIAHEDHSRRAVLSALALQRRLQREQDRLGAPAGTELLFRMGLNMGPVVVGGIGDNLRMDYTAVGDTTNLAARLQGLAEPGQILVSEAVERQVRSDFVLAPLPPTRVKGKSQPIQSFQVLSRRRKETSQAQDLTPFVGRERELGALEERCEQAFGGQGQVIGVTGEAGTGKSRLLVEFHRRLDPARATLLRGRCLSYGSGSPYLPLTHLLRQAGGISESDGPETVRHKLERNLELLGCEPTEHLPYLMRLLGAGDELPELTGRAVQERTFATLRRVFLNASRLRPVILEIEDLHWVDATSGEFLTSFIEAIAGAPVLVLLTYRSGFGAEWMQKSFATQIAMRSLSANASRDLAESLLEKHGLPAERADELLSKAEGNPFFLEEIVRNLAELDDGGVPDTVQGVLMARIDRLPEDHKRLLQSASVLGREFPLGVLEGVDSSARRLLPELSHWEFLYPSPNSEETYYFKHALTQEVIYDSLLTARRRELHERSGRAFEAVYREQPEDVLDRLSYHFSRSPDAARGVDYLARFAAAAAADYAHQEAARALREALERASDLAIESRAETTLTLVLQLADSLLPLAEFPQTLALLEDHRQLIEEIADPALRGRYFFWLAHTQSYLGDQEAACRWAETALAEAGTAEDELTAGKACYVLSREGFWTGRFAQGITQGDRALAAFERAGERWWKGQALWVAGFHHHMLGRHRRALECMDEALQISRDLEDYRLDPSWSTGYFLANLGDSEGGVEQCQSGLERAKDPLNRAAALGFLGYAYWIQGELEKADAALTESVEMLGGAGMLQLAGWFESYRAEVLFARGSGEAARQAAERALEWTERCHFQFGTALAHRTLGRLEMSRHEVAADDHLHQSIERFAALGVTFEEAQTLLDRAQLAEQVGDRNAGAKHRRRAHSLLEQLGVKVPRPAAITRSADRTPA
ncbi:MAG: adenylate/guanylate cyclase domain-containing protein [Acidobacteriota bacterium]